ncbi:MULTISPECIES: hypothetical protein [unclassified Bradyrhizobium]|uniref:hypothetical protein n=1 Tax=unclassified Bradyrhizobium TaxID=2631580 RepID=UPI00339A6150
MSAVKNVKQFTALTKQLRDWIAAKDEARVATNAFNRTNTATKKLFKEFVTTEAYPAKTKIVIDGSEFMWAVSESERIDPRKWYQLWQSKEITETQYFDALRVGKEDAKLAIGEDQVATISSMVSGTNADIRYDDANSGSKVGVEIVLPAMVKPTGGIKPRLGILQVPAKAPTAKRVIKVPVRRAG